MTRFTPLVLLVAVVCTSCATTRHSVLLGTGIGAGTGAVSGGLIGLSSDDTIKGTLIGTAVGAAFGALSGFLIDLGNQNDNETIDLSKKGISQKEDLIPELTKPQIERIWVEDKIEDDEYIKGHYIYKLKRETVWSKE